MSSIIACPWNFFGTFLLERPWEHVVRKQRGFQEVRVEQSIPNLTEAASAYHMPVLPREVVERLSPGEGKVFLDGTLGGGGHSELLLKQGARVIALDQDSEALAFARERLSKYGDAFVAVQSNFRDFAAVLLKLGIESVDGMLVDLGVSSHQLDEASRGFSFMQDGPLDMRMNIDQGQTAADLVNGEDETELARIFWEYGEMRESRRIARALVKRRVTMPFSTTADLADFLSSILPKRGKIHPATQSFQALRIAVNDELGALEQFLRESPAWLKPGGKLAVISFHSLEDRIVKHTFQRFATEWLDRPEWPEPRRNPEYCLKICTRKPLEAAADEVKLNPRARSARLRVAEKIGGEVQP